MTARLDVQPNLPNPYYVLELVLRVEDTVTNKIGIFLVFNRTINNSQVLLVIFF